MAFADNSRQLFSILRLINFTRVGNILNLLFGLFNKVEFHLLKKLTVKPREKIEILADYQTWINILEPELCKDAAAVECLARLLFMVRKEINNGRAGVRRASKILSEGIEALYLNTNAHKAAFELYLISLEGELKPQDEPLNIINAVIEKNKMKR